MFHFQQDRGGWAPKCAALRLAHPLVAYFSKPLEAGMPQLMGATWQLLLGAQVRQNWPAALGGASCVPVSA